MNGFSSGPEFHSNLPSAAVLGAAQQAAIAVTSAWSALHFVRQLNSGTHARRLAAAVLALLFVAIAVESLAGLPVASTSADVLRRTPLLLATTSVAFLITYRPRAAR